MFQKVSVSFRPWAWQSKISQPYQPLTLSYPLLNFKSPCLPCLLPIITKINKWAKGKKKTKNLCNSECQNSSAHLRKKPLNINEPWFQTAISLPTFQKSITLRRSCSWMQTLWLPGSSRVLSYLVLSLELGVLVSWGALILHVTSDGTQAALTNYQWWRGKWSKDKYSNSPVSLGRYLVLSKIHRNINPPGMLSNAYTVTFPRKLIIISC